MIANREAELPEMPTRTRVIWGDWPKPVQNSQLDLESTYNIIRDDKGGRILAALQVTDPSDHVMVVDYDDLVSPRLAALCDCAPGVPGWFFEDGYLFSNNRLSYYYPREFYELCGTSHIVKASLLLSGSNDDLSSVIRFRLGSHKFIKRLLESEGLPLLKLPLTGAAYRIGHAQSVSGSGTLIKHVFPLGETINHPLRALRKATRLRPYVPFRA